MFGYVKVFKDELKFKEDALYRRYYCELCRSIGSYSEFSRLFLSYDITFFMMLGINADVPYEQGNSCGALKCKSRRCEGAYDFFAAFGIALIYHKLNNDILDGAFLKRIPMSLVKRAYRRIASKYSGICTNIERGLKNIVRLEKENCTDYEYMSDLFAKSISDACMDFFNDIEDGEIRLRIIEAVARCVYLIDIIDDVEKDFKKKQYNPLNLKGGKIAEIGEIDRCVEFVFHILDNSYFLTELLPYSDNTPVISNILLYGIPFEVKRIRDRYTSLLL